MSRSNTDAVFGNELLFGKILSRLPVDSLPSCKWVCGSWRSLVRKDPQFNRSRAPHMYILDNNGGSGSYISLLVERLYGGPLFSAELQLCQGREGELQGRAIVQKQIIRPPVFNGYAAVIGVLHGLICFADDEKNGACIWDPSTGETTPWIYSPIAQQRAKEFLQENLEDQFGLYHKNTRSFFEESNTRIEHISSHRWYSFGYDPATKVYKVVLLWHKLTHIGPQLPISSTVCEVLTIGGRQQDLKWRMIDDNVSFPPGMTPSCLGKHLYASGFIYWLHKGTNPTDEPFILEFNVGTEKFTQVSIPSFIVDDINCHPMTFLVEAGGRPAIIVPDKEQELKMSMKMCILYDDHDRDKKLEHTSDATCTSCRSGGTTCSYYWMEETFSVPLDYWTPDRSDYIQSIPGTDLFIMRCTDGSALGFGYYNWREKIFYLGNEIEVDGVPSIKSPESGLYTWKPYIKSI